MAVMPPPFAAGPAMSWFNINEAILRRAPVQLGAEGPFNIVNASPVMDTFRIQNLLLAGPQGYKPISVMYNLQSPGTLHVLPYGFQNLNMLG